MTSSTNFLIVPNEGTLTILSISRSLQHCLKTTKKKLSVPETSITVALQQDHSDTEDEQQRKSDAQTRRSTNDVGLHGDCYCYTSDGNIYHNGELVECHFLVGEGGFKPGDEITVILDLLEMPAHLMFSVNLSSTGYLNVRNQAYYPACCTGQGSVQLVTVCVVWFW